jgi:hypothetical protein
MNKKYIWYGTHFRKDVDSPCAIGMVSILEIIQPTAVLTV